MPTSCAAYGCTAVYRKNTNTSFHRFPSNPGRRTEWIRLVRRVNFEPSKHTFLCSKHFEQTCFDRTGQTRRLREDAVPTIFDFPPHILKKLAARKSPLASEGINNQQSPSSTSTSTSISTSTSTSTSTNTITSTSTNTITSTSTNTITSTITSTNTNTNTITNTSTSTRTSTSTSTNTITSTSTRTSTSTSDNTTRSSSSSSSKEVFREHSYCLANPVVAKRKIFQLQDEVDYLRQQVKISRQRERRMVKKWRGISNLLEELREKNLMPSGRGAELIQAVLSDESFKDI